MRRETYYNWYGQHELVMESFAFVSDISIKWLVIAIIQIININKIIHSTLIDLASADQPDGYSMLFFDNLASSCFSQVWIHTRK